MSFLPAIGAAERTWESLASSKSRLESAKGMFKSPANGNRSITIYCRQNDNFNSHLVQRSTFTGIMSF
jgi:hypothetical protein